MFACLSLGFTTVPHTPSSFMFLRTHRGHKPPEQPLAGEATLSMPPYYFILAKEATVVPCQVQHTGTYLKAGWRRWRKLKQAGWGARRSCYSWRRNRVGDIRASKAVSPNIGPGASRKRRCSEAGLRKMTSSWCVLPVSHLTLQGTHEESLEKQPQLREKVPEPWH